MNSAGDASLKNWLGGDCPVGSLDMGQCAICYREIDHEHSVPTCFEVRICRSCERRFERKERSVPKSEQEKRHAKVEKLFLQGDAYPQVKCRHKAPDGSVAIARLAYNTKFFDQ